MGVNTALIGMQRARAQTVTDTAPGLQSKLHNQHAPKQAARHSHVPDTAELIREYAALQDAVLICAFSLRLLQAGHTV